MATVTVNLIFRKISCMFVIYQNFKSAEINLLLELDIPEEPSKPPTAYMRSFNTATPSVLLLASILEQAVHVSFTGSYMSTVRTLRDPLKPPTAYT